ncbi:MAG: ATP-binding protein [Candidatus Methanoplasma sp.]|jgi:predicted AAA+ superfamily ATPase|nr:ATP-binding protein [Candidatus Methanoplasma sp.]
MIVDGMVLREGYLSKLDAHRDRRDIAKIITGVRRCGKSVLMRQYMDRLAASGVGRDRIAYVNMESSEYSSVEDFREFDRVLRGLVAEGSRTYVFIDEVQNVRGWEKSVNALMVDRDVDVYLTGSNARLLSSELSTMISGRCVEIAMTPLSFPEYLELHPADGASGVESRFDGYVRYGALPAVDPDDPRDAIIDVLSGIYNTVLVKDVMGRLEMRDPSALVRISKFLMSNIGNRTSIHGVASEIGLSDATVERYASALTDALLLYRADRYDVRGKKTLSSGGKYYASDTGIRNAVLGHAAGGDLGRQLENVVYLELRRRGYEVVTGSYRDLEVDFAALKGGRTEYYQVAQTLLGDDVAEREARSLRGIGDSFPKTILSLDRVMAEPGGGISHVNLIDWLLGKA